MNLRMISSKMPTSNPEHQVLYEKARELISQDSLVSILRQLVDIPSPTGEEGALARHISLMLNDFDLAGQEQIIDSKQSNATGQITGSGDGLELLLYAPVDTVTSSCADEDLPWIGDELREDMVARSYVDDDHVFGLGAHNPKGHVACILEAARVIRQAQIPLKGNLKLGFGAGGMPTNARAGTRADSGHGAGCDYLLTNTSKPDCAVIAKSGWSVSWEEVGLIWFDVNVKGTHSYVGSRHLLPYRSAIKDAGQLIAGLEDWFGQWAEEHRAGLVAPQGVVSFIQSGWERMPAFTPATCRFRLDLRLSPRTSPEQAEQEFASVLKSLSDSLKIKTDFRRIVAIPGTTTDPEQLIIQRAISSWEAIEGKKHLAVEGLSGATDANILRSHKIPTARVGLPKARIPGIDFQLGMNAAAISDLYKLTEFLVHLATDVCNTDAGAVYG